MLEDVMSDEKEEYLLDKVIQQCEHLVEARKKDIDISTDTLARLQMYLHLLLLERLT